MPSLKPAELGAAMAKAFLGALSDSYPNVQAFAKTEFENMARWFALLGRQVAAGEVSKAQARLLMDMQLAAARNVFLTIEGLGLLAVEAAINAALGAVREAVNAAIGFALI